MSGKSRLFSDEWFEVFARNINLNPAYRRAASDWEGDLILYIRGDAESGNLRPGINRIAQLSLYHGECRGIKLLDKLPGGYFNYVIEGDASTWENVLMGKMDIVTAILKGSLKVTGNMAKLMKYLEAARELVKSAREVER
ncbi:MAG: SCP2 sterol-binding domain-containing protein [Thermoplasmata archaeon]